MFNVVNFHGSLSGADENSVKMDQTWLDERVCHCFPYYFAKWAIETFDCFLYVTYFFLWGWHSQLGGWINIKMLHIFALDSRKSWCITVFCHLYPYWSTFYYLNIIARLFAGTFMNSLTYIFMYPQGLCTVFGIYIVA